MTTEATEGDLDVLNIGTGHLKFNFNKDKPEEVEKAKKVLGDMLKRGYMLFVLVDGEQKRVRKFDPETNEYIIEEPDPIPPVKERQKPGPKPGSKQKRGPYTKRVAAAKTRATAIGPSAGG